MNGKRFVKQSNSAGTYFIQDKKDGTIVCFIMKYGRPQNQTDAMCGVMLKALNDAVENRRGETHE